MPAGSVVRSSFAVEAVLAVLVCHRVGSVLEVDAHARYSGLCRILHTVGIAVGEHLADQIRLVIEDAAHDLHRSARQIGDQLSAHGLGSVDAIAALRRHFYAHTVGQRGLGTCSHRAKREAQRGTMSTGRIGYRRAVEARAACEVGKAGGQLVDQQRDGAAHAADIVDLHGIADSVTDFGRDLVGGLLHQ